VSKERFRKGMITLVGVLIATCFWAPECRSEAGSHTSSRSARGILYGKIVAAGNVPVAGAQIIVMHRTTNAKFATSSDSRGFYRLTVDKGPYDLGAFVEGAGQYVGPIVVHRKTRYKIVWDVNAGLPAERLYGTVSDQKGRPMVGVTVVLHANEGAPLAFPHNASTTTDSDGSFLFENVPESYFDIVFSGEGVRETETIDVMKEPGACRVDFRLNTPNLNRWQPGMEAGIGDEVPGGDENNCTVTPSPPIPSDGVWYLVLGCGEGDYGQHEGQNEINCGTTCPISCWEIRVAADGRWGCKYAIHIWNTSFASTTGSISYKFTDSNNQVQKMWVFSQGEHVLNFNSSKPAIQEIYYQY
jgi:hypothetical protein